MSSLLALLSLCGDQGDTIARGTVVSRDGFQPVELGFARFDENLFHRAHGDSVQPQNTNVAADVDFARRSCGSDFPCTAHAPQPSGVLPTLASSILNATLPAECVTAILPQQPYTNTLVFVPAGLSGSASSYLRIDDSHALRGLLGNRSSHASNSGAFSGFSFPARARISCSCVGSHTVAV